MAHGAKAVVIGLGGSGLEVLQRLHSAANVELIALSTDEDAIWSLDDDIKRIIIRDPGALRGDVDEARGLLPSVFQELDSALSGVEMAVIAGFASKSDARIGGLVAGLCESNGLFTLIIQSGCPADAETAETVRTALGSLGGRGGGIIAACGHGNHADAVADAVRLLFASLSGAGYIYANREELRNFFRGRFFRLAAGRGADHGEAMQYALDAAAEAERGKGSALVLASGPELGIPEMRDATGRISAATGADGMKWVGVQSDSNNASMALILPTDSLPEAWEGGARDEEPEDAPGDGGADAAGQGGDGWAARSGGNAAEAPETFMDGEPEGVPGEVTPAAREGDFTGSGPTGIPELDLIPKIEAVEAACQYTGLEPAEESLSVEEAKQVDAEMLPISGLLADDANDAPSAAAVAEMERTAEELDIPEIGGGEGPEAGDETDTRAVAASIAESLRFRSPALIGIHTDTKKALEREVAIKRAYEKGIITREPREGDKPGRWRDDTDDAVSELSGYPYYSRAKPSQKKLGEYGFFRKFR